jgi:integrase
MAQKLNRLSSRFVATISKKGTYADGSGLFLQVGIAGQAKSWIFIYRRARLLGKTKTDGRKGDNDEVRRGYVGLGPVTGVSLAAAREKAQECRELLARGIDPRTELKRRRREQARAHIKTASFLTMGNDYILARVNDPENPWHVSSRKGAEGQLGRHLKPLHDWPLREITADQIYDIIQPLRHSGRRATAHKVRTLAYRIIEWARAREAFPEDKMNPASMKGRLRVLLNTNSTDPVSRPHPALHYKKIPALFAKLDDLTPRTLYTMGEAARAVGRGREYLYNMIRCGRLIATKVERPVFPNSWHHWLVEPAELFKAFPQVADVIPGLPSVSVYVLQFQILCACRPGEALGMRWKEYDEAEGIWHLPWQRAKQGWQTRLDNHIPLNEPAIAILNTLQKQQLRDGIKTEFVFGNYLVANPTSARIGLPPANNTVRNLLEKHLDATDVDKTLHGMRVAFGSWARNIGYVEADIERALSHIQGFGNVHVARLYGRDATREVPLRQLFADWGNYCLYGERPAEVKPLRLVTRNER